MSCRYMRCTGGRDSSRTIHHYRTTDPTAHLPFPSPMNAADSCISESAHNDIADPVRQRAATWGTGSTIRVLDFPWIYLGR